MLYVLLISFTNLIKEFMCKYDFIKNLPFYAFSTNASPQHCSPTQIFKHTNRLEIYLLWCLRETKNGQ